MRFECPSCKKPGQVDDAKIPESGVYAVCPDCSERFRIQKPSDFIFEAVNNLSPNEATPYIKPTNAPFSTSNNETKEPGINVKFRIMVYCLALVGILCIAYFIFIKNGFLMDIGVSKI